MSELVRHIAVSLDGTRVALGAFETHVAIYDSKTMERRSIFATCLEFGGDNLALSSDGAWCVTASETRVAMYAGDTGEMLWRRTDVKNVRGVAFSAAFSQNVLLFLASETQVISAKNGATLEKFPYVSRIYSSQNNGRPLLFLYDFLSEERDVYALYKGNVPLCDIPKESFALLDSVFTEYGVVIAESAGCLRAYDFNGSLLWRYTPPEGTHVLCLGYHQESSKIFGVLRSYRTHDADELFSFSFSGEREKIASFVQSPAIKFSCDSSQLFTSTASFSLPEGKILQQYENIFDSISS